MAALVFDLQVLKVLIFAEEILIGGCFFTSSQCGAVRYHWDTCLNIGTYTGEETENAKWLLRFVSCTECQTLGTVSAEPSSHISPNSIHGSNQCHWLVKNCVMSEQSCKCNCIMQYCCKLGAWFFRMAWRQQACFMPVGSSWYLLRQPWISFMQFHNIMQLFFSLFFFPFFHPLPPSPKGNIIIFLSTDSADIFT